MATKTTLRELRLALDVKERELEDAETRARALSQDVESLRRVIELMEETELPGESEQTPAKLIRNAAYDVLARSSEPIHYSLLRRRLEEMGIQVPGKDPDRNLAAHLSNDERFLSFGAGRWGLRPRSVATRTSRADEGPPEFVTIRINPASNDGEPEAGLARNFDDVPF